MKNFMDADFLLHTQTAKHLYHNVAENLPIIDYHCHLSPREIAEDKRYSDITEVWLYGDHYKWRAMRSCGIAEKYITGSVSDYEKFRAYCTAMPQLIGNPLYHWSHLELRTYFDCDLVLNEENCDAIWKLTAEKLADPAMSARQLILRSRVEVVGTTDDPADDLRYHKALKAEGFPVKVAPTFRPDKALAPTRADFPDYIKALGEANGVVIDCLGGLENALLHALDRFGEVGCRAADHGMDNYVTFAYPDPYHADLVFKRALAGERLSEEEVALFRTQMMRFLGREYVRRGMVMQLHFGVLRNPNTAQFRTLGPDAGYDIIHGKNCIADLAALLDYLSGERALPRTVLYSVNGADDDAVAVLCGAFTASEDGAPRVVQGSAWWFNDRIDGMRAQMRSFAGLASLGRFLGMLTDSRSFLSYPRHAYFRRIFCDLVGEWVENGEYPNDEAALEKLVRGVCCDNARAYFNF